jgi:hypothetical protein
MLNLESILDSNELRKELIPTILVYLLIKGRS